jgi:hypothetical protein
VSFRMGVQEDKVLPPGPYQAVLEDIEIKETAHGERLMWTFDVPSENAQVVGFSSLNEKTSAKAYQWASAIAGKIDPKAGWGPETVQGKRCTIYVDTARDTQGREKNKVQGVTAQQKEPVEPDHSGAQGQKQDAHNDEDGEEEDFADIPL